MALDNASIPESTEQDSFEQLRADMLREVPEAVREACHQKAEEFLAACVRYARLMQTGDDPWLGIRCLTESIIYIKEAQGRIEKELIVRRKPNSTVDMFME